ncbi:hypothetical protein [Sphaerimonospora thailandensis]|uniref:Uncharacterized protein n=1 Tax=Sphaerimonospora thailandensis TaxID=795644 RepID=A0A8J3R567_9ACTN|nr:hypothetical protein [Sphaerimonospora thailandensis]GIH69416.1 hypothetical protein Mth01_16690 [Sphaerimonospora thailandensis]
MTTAVITFVLGIIAVATFMIKGRQWPTFITAVLFGLYLGTTPVGEFIKGIVKSFFTALTGWLH